MAPCGPVVAVAAELWELWEDLTAEDAAAFEELETRYRSLSVSLLGLDEVRRGTLAPNQSRLYLTRAPLALSKVLLSLNRESGAARARVTACKIDRNLQVVPLTEARFAQHSATRRVERKLVGLETQLLSVYLVNLSAAHTFEFSVQLSRGPSAH